MLEALLQGKGDLDGLTVALAALVAHHHGHALDHLLAFVRKHQSYVVPLFLVALAHYPAVRDYATRETGNDVKVQAFARGVRDATERLLRHEVTLDGFRRAALDLWMVS